mmetsp:Transcript_3676/g.8557  ORF Transcript_3676/g.8557 Transcript_3676/m.8557 type:complete len:206 (+) Transcript_3676:1555-2172(+)
MEPIFASKSARVSVKVTTSVSAEIVAPRGADSRSAFSPKRSPGLYLITSWELEPDLTTATHSPLSRMKNSLPGSPCRMMTSPALKDFCRRRTPSWPTCSSVIVSKSFAPRIKFSLRSLPRMTDTKSSRLSRRTSTSSSATTVAARGSSRSSARSPKLSPGTNSRTSFMPLTSCTCAEHRPLSTMKKSKPSSPCLMMVSPGKCWTS